MLFEALVITRREIRDSLRDWRIVTPILILALVFPYVMQVSTAMGMKLMQLNGGPVPFDFAPLALLLVGFFPMSISLVIALEPFVGEKERNSLEPLFASPLSDSSLYIGKLLAALLLPLAASYVAIVAYLVTLSFSMHYAIAPMLLAQIVLTTTIEGLVMVGGAVVISAHTTSVRAANLLTSFIIIPMIFIVQLQALLIFWREYDVLWDLSLALLVVAVLLIRMGIATFNRDVILAREVDEVNLRRLLSQFRCEFVGDRPFSLRRIYTVDLPELIRANRLPLLATLAVVLIALGVGGYIAAQHPLPAGAIIPSQVPTGFEQSPSLSGDTALPGLDPAGIFFHNVRTLLLAAFLGMVSFGSAALLVLAAPLAFIGFFTAEVALVGINPLLFLAAFILPHGILEIPAAILATTFALRLGASLTAQYDGRPAGLHLMQALADWIKVFVFLVVPLLLVAAFVEAILTPLIVVRIFGG